MTRRSLLCQHSGVIRRGTNHVDRTRVYASLRILICGRSAVPTTAGRSTLVRSPPVFPKGVTAEFGEVFDRNERGKLRRFLRTPLEAHGAWGTRRREHPSITEPAVSRPQGKAWSDG
ncbi:MAG: hypothetical protein ACYCV7_14455 [Acidimicrobiales bacterium]